MTYKVGDRVRLLENGYQAGSDLNQFNTGNEGKVVDFYLGGQVVTVRIDGQTDNAPEKEGGWNFYLTEIEPA